MNAILVLFVILLVLMVSIGGKRGAKSFFTLILNFATLFITLLFIAIGFEPILVTVIGSIIISSTTLFYINGFNKKTISSLFSVIIVVLITMLLTYKMGIDAKIQGFCKEQAETLFALSMYVNLDFSSVVVCEILIGLLGAIIDVSISISSSMNEIYQSDPTIAKSSLLKSGMSIGKDILGTMTNTLLFAYISGFMALIIWFRAFHYSLSDIINGKVFSSEVFQVLSSGIGIILIIPVTAIITCITLYFKLPPKKDELEEKIFIFHIRD